jgi:hypothetical protein
MSVSPPLPGADVAPVGLALNEADGVREEAPLADIMPELPLMPLATGKPEAPLIIDDMTIDEAPEEPEPVGIGTPAAPPPEVAPDKMLEMTDEPLESADEALLETLAREEAEAALEPA